MPAQTQISKTIINAYYNAHYRVTGAGKEFVMRPKRKSEDLAVLMKKYDVQSAAFLTAYNPFSVVIKEPQNVRANKAMAVDLKKTGLKFFKGSGEDPSGNWKIEASFLVLGITEEAARELGIKYLQNAVIWVGNDAVSKVILLR